MRRELQEGHPSLLIGIETVFNYKFATNIGI